jgi:FAD/FMN-containing dehydrogenase
MTDLAKELAAVVGPAHVLTDPAVAMSYLVDWTGRWRGTCRLVVRPGSTEQVTAVIAACAAAGAPIVPQGGNTGLVGGGVPVDLPEAVLLSLRRLTDLGPVDRNGTVVAGAGSTLASIQQHAHAAGWDLGLDFASRDSATVGGAVATNAGGVRVLRYGDARRQVLGVEAVLASGALVSHVDGPMKESAGYDLGSLLAGSEGTLGVLTRVRVRLVPQLPARAVALLAVDGVAEAQAVLDSVQSEVDGLTAAELFLRDGLSLVLAATGAAPPFSRGWPAYLLLECGGRVDPLEALASVLADQAEVRDAAVASDATGRAALWRYREAHTESISAAGVPVKLDVGLPAAGLADAEYAIRAAVDEVAPGARVIIFGHLAEANLHVNVLDAPSDRVDAVSDAVLRTVAERGGSVSAEHGIGRAKPRWLGLTRSAADIAAMRRIKSALDPDGLLNPGVLFDR